MKKIFSIIMVIVIFSSSVLAATKDELQNQLGETKKGITSYEDELKEVKKDKKDTLSDIDSLDKKIGTTETQIENLKREINGLETEITVAEENIKYSEEQYQKKDEMRQERLIEYYKCGSISFWDTLFAADNLTDFFYRYKLMETIIDYDNTLLTELENDKVEIQNQKAQLETNKTVCEQKKALAEEQKKDLDETKQIRVTYLSKLNKEEELLSDSIDELKKKADDLTNQIKKLTEESNKTKYTGGTMTWPLPGYYYVSSPFGNRLHPVLKVYKMHTGVDIAGSGCNGKNVVAAADGKVIHSGWISGYGYCVMIDHGGGVVTLYAHSQRLLVKVGDQVKKGQKIMLVGMTGYATGPHLHFEVRINGKYVDPLNGYISSKN